ncbi:hypothetical protein [Bremerella sp. P1]|uniref:hypothetical protein n=1 Tax=Bremerella sp. P1 TaxID=3026424 RepID=UPI002368921E|nr:hypothetical protein [Bremerella sp. P1]WDI43966.1 hypothetical protein PSR63_08460 [Bremerella sp. P1]
MPYDLDMKKRSFYAPDDLWKKFRTACDSKKCQVNATLLELVAAVADGRIKLKTPKRPGLRFKWDLALEAEPHRFREKQEERRDTYVSESSS